MNHSIIFRFGVFSGVRNVFLTSCCVSGAAARQVGLVAEDVAEDGAGDADRIDAGMVVEAAILDGQDRLDHLARDGLQRHVAALLAAVGRDERRDERRVERDALDGLLVGRQLDGLDSRRLCGLRRPAAEDEPDGPALVVAVARDEHHARRARP